ncbi:MAG: diphosphomevalonate decarboxylase [Thermoplasmata archaeon]|uniref:Diphosphomevalonate decarboxylase n=1 Tax=Candidatus Sysuiplasma superficiale TaxID=2823368 RepID=A0A8J8CDE0_9ARCH|nr:diphosphomevalonate decarboxylase [Candidatus Sysuiplasma superficiale]MBX8644135.1 diphosphomevalonate decarboxylase [Candidatus Sysuiplasma superficiale]MCL4346304.1 diphosphomevalonate decarboxylase [Candidatus Thermoplasmatota archaeon]MCL5437106.1 diphosphomevalonate decarboxylase [Candidatus Thermoplasmatota archaeon]
MSSKATAIAHPMQGLIKYHGLRDERLRLPFHDSISVATAPLKTTTTVEFGDFERSSVEIDGKRVSGRPLERVMAVMDRIREMASIEDNFRIVSESDFESGIGLGASASGFAALATAACSAARLEIDRRQLSAIARLGAGSATRSVAGGFARWEAGSSDSDSYAYSLAAPEELQMGIVVAIVRKTKRTEDAHREVLSSPLYQGRLAYLHTALAEMTWAIRSHNVSEIGRIAERDTLVLHAITMTGNNGMILWKPETLKIIEITREMRKEGLNSFFSIDTGATVYINCPVDEIREVEERIRSAGIETVRCSVGGPSRLVDTHLF